MTLHLNTEPIKYAIVALSAPFWLPFMKALLREFNDALRDEGGLLGRAPTKSELAALDDRHGKFESPLLSERWEDVDRNERQARSRQRSARRGGATVRRGFRTTR